MDNQPTIYDSIELTSNNNKEESRQAKNSGESDLDCNENVAYTVVGENNGPKDSEIMILHQPTKKKYEISSIQAVVGVAIVISCLALIGVCIEAGVLVYAILGSNRDQMAIGGVFDSLGAGGNGSVQSMVIKELQETVEKLLENQAMLVTNLSQCQTSIYQLKNLQFSVNTLNTSTMDQLNDLQSSVNTLGIERNTTAILLIDLQSSVNILGSEQNATAIHVDSLQSSVNTLLRNAQPYRNCIEETMQCTTQMSSGTASHCRTPGLPVDKMGYYTIGMRCLYNPPPEKWDTSTLRQRGSEVECLCVALSGTSPQGAHTVDTFSSFTCTLTVTRCSLS